MGLSWFIVITFINAFGNVDHVSVREINGKELCEYIAKELNDRPAWKHVMCIQGSSEGFHYGTYGDG